MNSYKIIRSPEVSVNKMYTVRGFVGDPKMRNDRYIQFSDYTGEPIINTRCAYSLRNVVTFSSESEAFDFMMNFIGHPDRRNKYYIDWKIIPYRPSSSDMEYTFKEFDSKYGKCYFISKARRVGRDY